MLGWQGGKSGRGRRDATAVTGIGIGEIAAEASHDSIELAGARGQVDQRAAIAVCGQMRPHRRRHADVGEDVLARYVQWERARERARHVQAPDRSAKCGCDLPLAHSLRDEDEQVREADKLLLPGPIVCEPEVALRLAEERTERLGAPVLLQVELARAARMQVAPEPVGLDLRGFRPDPVLGAPCREAVGLDPPGGLDERAEERVHPEAVGEQQVGPVAVVGDPRQVRDPDALGVGDLDNSDLCEVPACWRLPSPKPLPTVKDETRPRSLSSFIRC
jgi:hypothetical protein